MRKKQEQNSFIKKLINLHNIYIYTVIWRIDHPMS